MSTAQGASTTRYVETPSGQIARAEAGSGPVALFVYGITHRRTCRKRY
jgi:hypothetical protein